MISFSLACNCGHAFQAWFGSQADFESQKKRDLVSCPRCDGTQVEKALMAPKVTTGRAQEQALREATGEMRKAMRALHENVTKNADDVGPRFAEEARKIHYGETESRGIYGQATKDDVKGLVDEGIPIAPLPVLPEDAN